MSWKWIVMFLHCLGMKRLASWFSVPLLKTRSALCCSYAYCQHPPFSLTMSILPVARQMELKNWYVPLNLGSSDPPFQEILLNQIVLWLMLTKQKCNHRNRRGTVKRTLRGIWLKAAWPASSHLITVAISVEVFSRQVHCHWRTNIQQHHAKKKKPSTVYHLHQGSCGSLTWRKQLCLERPLSSLLWLALSSRVFLIASVYSSCSNVQEYIVLVHSLAIQEWLNNYQYLMRSGSPITMHNILITLHAALIPKNDVSVKFKQ